MRITPLEVPFVVVKFCMATRLLPQERKFNRTTNVMVFLLNITPRLQNFTISSGTTGEAITANGAIGVSEQQKASNIQIGRYLLNEKGVASEQPYDVDAVIIGNGDNSLFGVGSTKNDFLFTTGTGLKATPAEAVGATANEPLANVFKLSLTWRQCVQRLG